MENMSSQTRLEPLKTTKVREDSQQSDGDTADEVCIHASL